ncbi:MAG: hypothetical protein LBH36_00820 [Candidatus Nomurabacteria bacterium]|jgi:hypothetical protein|nr:hypothetical protein [Candidatus Nomurabacteria bacterium]
MVREYINNFKDIVKNHKSILIAMVALFLVSLVAVVILLLNIHPSNLQVWFRYANFGESFYRTNWIYFVSFVVEIFIVCVANNLIAIKFTASKGKVMSLAFLVASIFIVIFTLIVAINLFGINKEAGIWT